jgi:hypothetical protein
MVRTRTMKVQNDRARSAQSLRTKNSQGNDTAVQIRDDIFNLNFRIRIAVFGDALRRLAATATYLYQDGPRFHQET